MSPAGMSRFSPATRTLAKTAGLLTLLALQPEPSRVVEASPASTSLAGSSAHILVLSAQAERYLSLQSRSFSTEFIGCMIGDVHGPVVIVRRIAPADVEPRESAPTHVMPKQTCEGAGWAGTVGVIHSHPTAERCWYYFPGTQVLSSDGQSFLYQPYPVDAIMCGHRVVWISRDMAQRQVPLGAPERQAAAPRRHQRGNLVQAGAASAAGGGGGY